MAYTHFPQCAARLSGIQPIDFFLAAQLSQEYGQAKSTDFFHVILALSEFVRQGHSCLPLNALAGKTLWYSEELSPPAPGYRFPDEQSLLALLSQIPSLTMPAHVEALSTSVLVLEKNRLYLRRYWRYECEVALMLGERLGFSPLQGNELARALKALRSCYPDDPQDQPSGSQVAVAGALGRRFAIITGGPGTGKTYTATRLLLASLAVAEGKLRIRMAAPTGKAAQRLNESIAQGKTELLKAGVDPEFVNMIPETAQTVHRLLGYRSESVQPRYHQDHPLHCDLLLLDEVSMIDLPMLCRILRALPAEAKLVMLGDANQLPSVEVGNTLGELTKDLGSDLRYAAAEQIQALTGYLPPNKPNVQQDYVTRLDKSWRFSSQIGDLANQVYRGAAKESWALLEAGQESDSESPSGSICLVSGALPLRDWLKNVIQEFYLPVLNATDLDSAFAALSRFRILTPTRVGLRGVEALNQLIEGLLAGHGTGAGAGRHYLGRPVMVTENHYGVRLFNGDVGMIWPDSQGKMMGWFEGGKDENGQMRYRSISLARLPKVEPVYAMTIHKTQGSEFDHVAILLPEQDSELLSRQLLYTGITRAKKRVTVFGQKGIWEQAVNREALRYSGLGERLRRNVNEN